MSSALDQNVSAENSHTQTDDPGGSTSASALGLACNRCRRAKLRCSRERPACQHCRKAGFECVYENKRTKPGLKGGAVENIHRRLDALERVVQERDWSSLQGTREELRYDDTGSGSAADSASQVDTADSVLALLARELPRLVKLQQHQQHQQHQRRTTAAPDAPPPGRTQTEQLPKSRKRQRVEAQISEGGDSDDDDGPALATSAQAGDSEAPALNGTSQQHNAEGSRRGDGNDDGDNEDVDDDRIVLPATSLESLEPIIEKYFSHVHPWIPMLHQDQFRYQISQGAPELAKIDLIILAMIVSTAKFFRPDEELDFDIHSRVWRSDRTRRWVVSSAMDRLSVEGLQTLIIMAFNDIGDGNSSKAWPIVGSLTRTVEYLQLTKEPDECGGSDPYMRQQLCRPFETLPPARDWTELEERRRVFWNVFNLDRLCSVTMGWNTSLTSDDVKRRLPADGILWRKRTPVVTPYLGIWDKAAGRIGNPMAVTSSRYQGPPSDQPVLDSGDDSPSPAVGGHGGGGGSSSSGAAPLVVQSSAVPTADMSRVGAFAYSVEATESMSRVTTYFLQQPLTGGGSNGSYLDGGGGELSGLLTRFKELDLRLVHWKMLLPQKWKSGVAVAPRNPGRGGSSSGSSTSSSRQWHGVVGGAGTTGANIIHNTRMDPNLTLAHVTHNTSMILLHQPIAYPPPRSWLSINRRRLPSSCSAETCCSAAVEIANITQNYLRVTNESYPVSSQYPFCLYVAARMLLVHWRSESDNSLLDEFWVLVQGLDEMSRRWSGAPREDIKQEPGSEQGQGREAPNRGRKDLAAKYALKLRELHELCAGDENFRIDISYYTQEIDNLNASSGATTLRREVSTEAPSPAPGGVRLPLPIQSPSRPPEEPRYPTKWAPHNGHIPLPSIRLSSAARSNGSGGSPNGRPSYKPGTTTTSGTVASTPRIGAGGGGAVGASNSTYRPREPYTAPSTPSSHSIAGAAGNQILHDQPTALLGHSSTATSPVTEEHRQQHQHQQHANHQYHQQQQQHHQPQHPQHPQHPAHHQQQQHPYQETPQTQAQHQVLTTPPVTSPPSALPPPQAPMLMDQYFVEMDRVISFDDGSMFASGFEGGGVGW